MSDLVLWLAFWFMWITGVSMLVLSFMPPRRRDAKILTAEQLIAKRTSNLRAERDALREALQSTMDFYSTRSNEWPWDKVRAALAQPSPPALGFQESKDVPVKQVFMCVEPPVQVPALPPQRSLTEQERADSRQFYAKQYQKVEVPAVPADAEMLTLAGKLWLDLNGHPDVGAVRFIAAALTRLRDETRAIAQQEMRNAGFQHPKDVEAMILRADMRGRIEAFLAAEMVAHTIVFRCHAENDRDFHSGCVQTRDSITAAIRALRSAAETPKERT